MPLETLREVALHMARSLIDHGFRVVALLSTDGGNQAALEQAAQELERLHLDVAVCVPRGMSAPIREHTRGGGSPR